MNWDSSSLWGIIGLTGGILVSYFFYFLGIERKSLIYNITTTTLISEDIAYIEKLNVIYNGKQIKNLYVSTINIKNNGNTIIEPDDFSNSEPLSFITDGELIYPPDYLSEIKSNDLFLLYEIGDNNICQKAIIHFDYISKNEAIFCEVIHTNSLSVKGRLKNGVINNIEIKNDHKIFLLGFILAIIISIIFYYFQILYI